MDFYLTFDLKQIKILNNKNSVMELIKLILIIQHQ